MVKKCSRCGNKWFLTKLSDGYACPNCICIYQGTRELSTSELYNLWKKNQQRLNRFNKNQEISEMFREKVCIDYNNKLFYFEKKKNDPIVFCFSEVKNYNVNVIGEKQVTKTKGGITRAIVGGAIAGPVGAIVGANTSKQEATTSGGTSFLDIYFDLSYGEYKYTTSTYPSLLLNFLDECIRENRTNTKKDIDSIGEIKKYKELLDIGAITSEEFESKKKELLNL